MTVPSGTFRLPACILAGILLFAACGREDVEVYRVAKESPMPDRSASLPAGHPPLDQGMPGDTGSGGMPAGHPPLGAGGSAASSAGMPDAGSSEDIHWKTPAGWQEAPGSGMRFATFYIGEGGKRAEVSVVSLRSGGGGLLPNVNRWRGQAGLGPVDAGGLARESKKVRSPAGEAVLVDIRGPKLAIIAATLDAGGQTWFFKMWGPKETVAGAKEDFRQLIAGLHHHNGS